METFLQIVGAITVTALSVIGLTMLGAYVDGRFRK